jgi:hypothetical protein
MAKAAVKLKDAATKVEEHVDLVRTQLADAWLPEIYRQRVLTKRSRSYDFAGASAAAVKIQHTLLGVELKLGRRRLMCPDLATARYLSVFARAGCKAVAVPYDITKISQLADEMESGWHRMFLLADHRAANESEQTKHRIRRALIRRVRIEIAEAGAGTRVPEFRQTTRQRS